MSSDIKIHQNSSDIDLKDFINFCKKCTVKPYSFLVINAIHASDNPSCFRKLFKKEYKNNHDNWWSD